MRVDIFHNSLGDFPFRLYGEKAVQENGRFISSRLLGNIWLIKVHTMNEVNKARLIAEGVPFRLNA
jgi:hypothetical protein